MLPEHVRYLDPAPAVFEAMLEGWALQQRTRFLKGSAIGAAALVSAAGVLSLAFLRGIRVEAPPSAQKVPGNAGLIESVS